MRIFFEFIYFFPRLHIEWEDNEWEGVWVVRVRKNERSNEG